MRIAIIGTCQVFGMASAAQAMLPHAEVIGYQPMVPHTTAEIRARVAGCDIIITQFIDAPTISEIDRPLTTTTLASLGGAVSYMPPMVFTGFHPDGMYLGHEGVLINGPHAQYHSTLALAGFLAGFDAKRTAALFNAHVFAELGYFDAYPASRARLLTIFSAHGYAFDRALEAVEARGTAFMHTINHPAIAMLWAQAAAALAHHGLVDPLVPFDDATVDFLADRFVAPVFPPLARRLGVVGGTCYRRAPEEMAPGAVRDVPIADYVSKSFDIYRTCNPAALRGSVPSAAAARKLAELTA